MHYFHPLFTYTYSVAFSSFTGYNCCPLHYLKQGSKIFDFDKRQSVGSVGSVIPLLHFLYLEFFYLPHCYIKCSEKTPLK